MPAGKGLPQPWQTRVIRTSPGSLFSGFLRVASHIWGAVHERNESTRVWQADRRTHRAVQKAIEAKHIALSARSKIAPETALPHLCIQCLEQSTASGAEPGRPAGHPYSYRNRHRHFQYRQ